MGNTKGGNRPPPPPAKAEMAYKSLTMRGEMVPDQ